MDRGKSRAGGERQMKRGYIAKPDQQLWIGADRREIEKRQDTRTTPPAPHCEDGAHVGIGEHRIDVRGAVRIRPRQIAPAFGQMLAQFGLEAHCNDGFLDQIQVEQIVGKARRLDQAHRVAGTQARRFSHCCGRRSLRSGQSATHRRQHHAPVQTSRPGQNGRPSLWL